MSQEDCFFICPSHSSQAFGAPSRRCVAALPHLNSVASLMDHLFIIMGKTACLDSQSQIRNAVAICARPIQDTPRSNMYSQSSSQPVKPPSHNDAAAPTALEAVLPVHCISTWWNHSIYLAQPVVAEEKSVWLASAISTPARAAQGQMQPATHYSTQTSSPETSPQTA